MTVETHTSPAPRRTAPATRRRRRTRRAWTLVLLVVLVLAACVVLLVRDALIARDALEEVAVRLPPVEQTLRTLGDGAADATTLATAESELADLAVLTATARDHTDGPLWAAAGLLPVVGENARAAGAVTATLDDVTATALPALTRAAAALTGSPTVDLAGLSASAGPLQTARTALETGQDRLAGLDLARVHPVLAEPSAQLAGQVDELTSLVATAERGAVLLPPMLGADGPRTYLLLALNNAELRAGGGIPGAMMVLRTDDGAVEVVRHEPSSSVGPFAEPVLPLHADDLDLHSDLLGTYLQSTTSSPDFPTTARLAAEMWQRTYGEEVDGVIATDPVALSFVLAATGPVTIDLPADLVAEAGQDALTVDADSVVDVLLRQVYLHLPPEVADDLFAVVAAEVVERLDPAAGDAVPLTSLLPAVEAAAADHRLAVWSARPDEQERLAGTVLARGFTADADAASAVGVFFDDGIAGKMTAYLDADVAHTGSRCTAAGRLDTVTVRLASTAPEGVDLPWYVAGVTGPGRPDPGTIRLNVTAVGPVDGSTPRVRRDGDPIGGRVVSLHGRVAVPVTVELPPGGSTVLELDMLADGAAPRAQGVLDIWSTPTVTTGGLRSAAVPSCD